MTFARKHLGTLMLFGAVVVTVIIIVVVALTQTPQKSASEGPSAPQTATPETPSTTPTPSQTDPKVIGEDAGSGTQDCNVLMPSDEYAVLIDRTMKYEQLRLQPASPDKEQTLVPFTTKKYQADHSGDPMDASANVVVEVNAEKTRITCQVIADDRVVVLVRPVITTYEVDASGNKTILNGDLPMPAHYSGWLKQGTDWMVDSEY